MSYKQLTNLEVKISDGILYCRYKENLNMTLDMARQMLDDRLRFQAGKDYPVVIILNGLKAADKTTRQYAGAEGTKGISMGAFVVKNIIERVIFNFFFSLEKPKIPTKAFTTEEDAVKWINEIRTKTQNLNETNH